MDCRVSEFANGRSGNCLVCALMFGYAHLDICLHACMHACCRKGMRGAFLSNPSGFRTFGQPFKNLEVSLHSLLAGGRQPWSAACRREGTQ